jgi:hypothetical protein
MPTKCGSETSWKEPVGRLRPDLWDNIQMDVRCGTFAVPDLTCRHCTDVLLLKVLVECGEEGGGGGDRELAVVTDLCYGIWPVFPGR